MNERIDIMCLMPDSIGVMVGNKMFSAWLINWKYILNENLWEYLEADNVYIYINDKLFDTIDKRIALRAWDTLHLEYSIYVGE